MSELRLQAGAAGALAPRAYHLAQEPHPPNGTALGFWLYLMSDCLIFAALFATYGVLGRSYAAGPTGAQLFDLTLVAINTAFLLLSSITFGLIWLVVLMLQIKKHGLIPENTRRLMCLSMFWHFLDVVWIGVFTFVYLMGVL